MNRYPLLSRSVATVVTALMLALPGMSTAATVGPTPAAVAAATARTTDGKIDVNGVRYHYLIAQGHGTPVVLLHGWGSTSYMWRFVMPQLAARGYTVIAPDLRGLGDTSKPATGYDKANIAEDIRDLVAKLGYGPKIHIAGHDMGGMVAYAYAAQHPTEVKTLTILDVPLPGIAPWNDIVQTPRVWHFAFFGQRDVGEMLMAGHEKEFMAWFHNNEAVNSRAFTNEVEAVYARQYSMPGAMRAGFEYYRAFPQDVIANQKFAEHKLTMPVLGIGGDGSFGPIIGAHLQNVATDVHVAQIKGSGHWVAEEQPEQVTAALVGFLPPAGN
ncbi:pimeloyl-ACP methyl ester carboxylesterase [Silvimonas terrae]|uniref:Pimeloyl-ACP methyl ester carboxylesterase n=1 Tax=Silvimonas terrae TaxID=300266 RepID=A0A840RDB1_9NEIS|nr:alpha/beta hydrolase [Silvimonas terrae]MBB5190416.1 pimeloyl-ACP methyl ester carboxylesterase [Silvimonas terrae]